MARRYFVKGYGFGLIGNIIVGVVGAFLGSYLFPLARPVGSSRLAGPVLSATLGAVILLFVIGLIRRVA